MITAENILLVGSVLIFTSILISKTGYRFGIPTLLLFLLVGMAFGSDGLGIQFNSASDAQFIGMMALSIILFSGGMDTRYSDIKPVLKQGILLSTVGVLVTTLLTGLFIYFYPIIHKPISNLHCWYPCCLPLPCHLPTRLRCSACCALSE